MIVVISSENGLSPISQAHKPTNTDKLLGFETISTLNITDFLIFNFHFPIPTRFINHEKF